MRKFNSSNICNAHNSEQFDSDKRKMLVALTVLPLLTACGAVSSRAPPAGKTADALNGKFRGLYGGVLRLDAATPKRGVSITSGTGAYIAGPSLLSLQNVSYSTYTSGSAPVPNAVRATWREGDYKQNRNGSWDGGTLVGDYTVPVAERIPDDFLDFIRANGGALRLKIRLVDDGILIGWDVEYIIPYKDWKPNKLGLGSGISYLMAGGDFREAIIYNGKIVERGWYINKSGQKVETDY